MGDMGGIGRWRSPFRAWLWKEWRESWELLALTALLPLALVMLLGHRWESMAIAMAIVLSLAMMTLGARLFAAERAMGTETFRDERPVARGLIWAAKVLPPLSAMAMAWAAYLVCALSHGALTGCLERIPGSLLNPVAQPLLWAVAFSIGALCSVVMDRTIAAVAAGYVLLVVVLLPTLAVSLGWLGFNTTCEWPISLILLVEAAVLLGVGRWVFIKWRRD